MYDREEMYVFVGVVRYRVFALDDKTEDLGLWNSGVFIRLNDWS